MNIKFQKYNGQVIEINVTGTEHIIEQLLVYDQPIEYQKQMLFIANTRL